MRHTIIDTLSNLNETVKEFTFMDSIMKNLNIISGSFTHNFYNQADFPIYFGLDLRNMNLDVIQRCIEREEPRIKIINLEKKNIHEKQHIIIKFKINPKYLQYFSEDYNNRIFQFSTENNNQMENNWGFKNE